MQTKPGAEHEQRRLREKYQQLEGEMHNLYHQLYLRNIELEAIHRSKIWRLWMVYHAWRRRVIRLLSLMAGSVRAMARGLAYLAGQAYLLILIPVIFLRARVRSWRRQGQDLISMPEDLAVAKVGRRPRVLIVMPYAVFPPDHGGGVRLYNLLQHLSKSCDISMLIFSQQGEDEVQREVLSPWCRSVDFHHWVPRLQSDRFRLEPPNRQIFWSEEAHSLMRHLIEQHDIDILQLEYTELGQYYSAAPAHVKVLLTEHDIAFRSLARRRKHGFNKRFPEGNLFGNTRTDWRRLVRYELAMCRHSDQIHVMSADDGAFLANFLADGGKRLRVLPNGVDTSHYAPAANAPPRQGVLLVGNFQNLPNVDSLEYLVAEIWPLLRKRCPQATLNVVGAKTSERVLRFHGQDGISVIGAVPDLLPWYAGHRVLAAPIRAGSGTRLKLLEAFAAGLPVVSTSIGAEGIAYEHGRHLLIADTAESFARDLERLLSDDDLHTKVAHEARALVCGKYDWSRLAEAMMASYRELVGQRLGESSHRAADDKVIPTPATETSPAPEKEGSEPPPPVDAVRPTVTRTVKSHRGKRGASRDVLITGIYLADQPNYVDDVVRILSASKAYKAHQSWVALNGEPPSDRVAGVTVRCLRERAPKSSILNEIFASHDLERYEYVVVCDDDVALPERFLDQFLTLQQQLGFAIAQPARTVNSYIDLPIVEQHPGVLARQTLFVEQGPVVSFHRSAFDFVIPFDVTSPMGWGLENVWSLQASRRGLRMGIIDNVPVDHSMRKPVANYRWAEADRGRTALFSKVEHRPTEECFKVLALVPLEGSDG